MNLYLRYILKGYDAKSLWALAVLVGTGSAVGYRFSDLLDVNGGTDWLLTGIWVALTLLTIWRVQPRRDLLLVLVGLSGGAVIETWGTHTELWRYFTDERPPLWILPAWPIAALAIDRLGTQLGWLLRGSGTGSWWLRAPDFRLYWATMVAFLTGMFWFMRPTLGLLSSQLVAVLMLLVSVTGRQRHRDLELFAAGAALGLFLEYWGTSRACWMYYTGETPPTIAVVAHGFAAVAFCRGEVLVSSLLKALWGLGRPLVRPRFRATRRPL
jgi:hypothetical protein